MTSRITSGFLFEEIAHGRLRFLLGRYWIVVKFLLTSADVTVLLLHMPTVCRMSNMAAQTTFSAGDFETLRLQLVVHAAGGLLVLLTATALSVYKPWGRTSYGRRTRGETS